MFSKPHVKELGWMTICPEDSPRNTLEHHSGSGNFERFLVTAAATFFAVWKMKINLNRYLRGAR